MYQDTTTNSPFNTYTQIQINQKPIDSRVTTYANKPNSMKIRKVMQNIFIEISKDNYTSMNNNNGELVEPLRSRSIMDMNLVNPEEDRATNTGCCTHDDDEQSGSEAKSNPCSKHEKLTSQLSQSSGNE
jgi:hypothetical protein